MKLYQEIFLQATSQAMANAPLSVSTPLSQEDWEKVLELATQQNLSTYLLPALLQCEDFIAACPDHATRLRSRLHHSMTSQIKKTHQFLDCYRFLEQRGLHPIVVKGIICRNITPNGDLRPSNDEDLLIEADSYKEYKNALLEYGFEVAQDSSANEDTSYEVSYHLPHSELLLEVHKSLFDQETTLFHSYNEFFKEAYLTASTVTIEGTTLTTLDATHHLFFLILHAMKHFISSGFGLRQVMDISTFAMHYGTDIDWDDLYDMCQKTNALTFSAGLFQIGKEYLHFSPESAHLSTAWMELSVDATHLLEDLLDAGLFGGSSLTRKHSSTLTLNAALAADAKGKVKSSMLSSLFPSKKYLVGRYPYLEKMPFLLPIAWLSRICHYILERNRSEQGENNLSASIELGKSRIDLLKEYDIL